MGVIRWASTASTTARARGPERSCRGSPPTANLRQQLLGGSAANRVELATHGRKRWAGILRLKNIIEADHRQIARHMQPARLGRIHHADRHDVAHGYNRGRVPVGGVFL